MKKFWAFSAEAGSDEAELTLYGVLAEETWWGDEVTPKLFADELKALGPVSKIKVRLNSPGGDLFAGTTIHNLLRDHPAAVTVYIDGLAASAASIIAMAGRVVMPPSAMMMVHNPSTIAYGDAREMRATAEVLDKVRDSMIAAYQEKTGMERAALISMLNAETWLTAKEAVEQGFADEIDEQAAVTASVKGRLMIVNGLGFDLARFKTIPAAFAATADPEPSPEPTTEEGAKPGSSVAADLHATVTVEVAQASSEPQEEPAEEPTAEAEPGEPEENPEQPPVTEEPEAEDPVAAERARVQAILALSVPGAEEIVNRGIDSGASPGDVAQEIVKSPLVRNAASMQARKNDAPRAIPGGTEPQADGKQAKASGLAAALQRIRGL